VSNLLKTLLRVAVTLILVVYVGLNTDWNKVGPAIAKLDLRCGLGAVALLAVTQILSAFRWRICSRQLGIERSMAQHTGFYFIGMYFNLLLPTSVGGDVVRAWYLNGGSGRKLRAVASVLLDRVSGVIVLVALACAATLVVTANIPTGMLLSPWVCLAAGIGGIGGLVLLTHMKLLPVGRREQLKMILSAARAPGPLALSTLCSLVVQLANVVVVWILALGLGLEIPFSYCCVFVPMVAIITMLPIGINGIGLREKAMAVFLVPVGIAEELGVTLSLLWFAVTLTVSMIGGLVYLFGSFPRPQTAEAAEISAEGNDDGSVDGHPDQGREGQLGRAA
jgi:glycosyltransferase 2 family protein